MILILIKIIIYFHNQAALVWRFITQSIFSLIYAVM